MRVQAANGCYLVRWGPVPVIEPFTAGREPRLVVTDSAVLVGTFHPSPLVSIFTSEPKDFEPALLDTRSWDAILETSIEASGPLQVSSPDGSPPLDERPWLTREGGRWRIRVYMRREGFIDDSDEDAFIQFWRVT